MRHIINLLFLILSVNILNAQTNEHLFRWNLEEGQRLEIVRTADVIYIENTIQRDVYEERNIIDLTAYRETANGQGFQVQGIFKTYSRKKGENVFKLNREYQSDFIIEKNGRYIVPKKYFMPNVRSIPTFPDTSLRTGDSWHAQSEEHFDTFDMPLKLVLNPSYLISSYGNINGTNTADINYHVIINKDLNQAGLRGDSTPYVIYGYNYGTYIWDIDRNIPITSDEYYHILFGFGPEHQFASIEYKMNFNTDYHIYEPIETNMMKKESERLSESLRDSDIEVSEVDEGIVLRLGEILFATDSDKLKNDSKDTLEKIVKTIKEIYPDREIIIEGHTDNKGNFEYNQKLSESRAKTVAKEIKNDIDHDKVSYKGLADTEPIDDNKTVEGRARNRRVDIIIKLR